MKISKLFEDAQHSGHKKWKKTPRRLDSLDYDFLELNVGRKPGQEIALNGGRRVELEGSSIIKNSDDEFIYAHFEDGLLHIEYINTKEKIWNSLHLPSNTAKYLPKD